MTVGAGRGRSRDGGPEGRELWPRDFGRDGVSGLVTVDRAMRARDVSRPGPEDDEAARRVLGDLLARVEGRRPPAARPGDPRTPAEDRRPAGGQRAGR